MALTGFIVTLGSEQPELLRDWYADVVGLAPLYDFTPGAFGVDASGFPVLIIEGHSEVAGPAREPQRVLLNLMVDDIRSHASRLEGLGVEFVRPTYEEQGVGFFATFSDPDGNLCQLVQLFG